MRIIFLSCRYSNICDIRTTILGADHLTFEGGGGDFETKFSCKAMNKKNTCTNKLREKYPAPLFGGKKMLQNSMVAGIDLTSPRRSAGLIFRD
jgi:hypothetical protein